MGRGRGRGVTNLPAWMTQGNATGGVDTQLGGVPAVAAQSSSVSMDSRNVNIASKIMSNMGYQDGLGLGRDGHGISKPLEHTKGGSILMDSADR